MNKQRFFFYSKEGNEFQNQYIWEKYESKVSHLEFISVNCGVSIGLP